MVARELLHVPENQWEGTICQAPKAWIVEVWSHTYCFLVIGSALVSQTKKHHLGKFSKTIDPKEGYQTADYKDLKQRKVLEFLVPILVLDSVRRISASLANNIIGSFLGESSNLENPNP